MIYAIIYLVIGLIVGIIVTCREIAADCRVFGQLTLACLLVNMLIGVCIGQGWPLLILRHLSIFLARIPKLDLSRFNPSNIVIWRRKS